MATLEITVSNRKTGQIKARQLFELDDDLVRLFLEQLDMMLASLPRPVQVVKTITPDGATTIDLLTAPHPPPQITGPSFEDIYRRQALPPPREETLR
jgi:hypothetical protein